MAIAESASAALRAARLAESRRAQAELSKLFREVESDLLKLANRSRSIRTHPGEVSQWIAQYQKNAAAIRSRLETGSKNWAETAIPRTYEDGMSEAARQVRLLGGKVGPTTQTLHRDGMRILAEGAYNRLLSSSEFVFRRVDDVWRSMALESIRGSVAGYETVQTAAGNLLDRWAESGMTGFVDAAGREWNMETYANMVARTSTMEAHLTGLANRLSELGQDVVEVDSHDNPCPTCANWEGVLLSLSGASVGTDVGGETVEYTLAEAEADGLFHPNCEHGYGLVAVDFRALLEEEGGTGLEGLAGSEGGLEGVVGSAFESLSPAQALEGFGVKIDDLKKWDKLDVSDQAAIRDAFKANVDAGRAIPGRIGVMTTRADLAPYGGIERLRGCPAAYSGAEDRLLVNATSNMFKDGVYDAARGAECKAAGWWSHDGTFKGIVDHELGHVEQAKDVFGGAANHRTYWEFSSERVSGMRKGTAEYETLAKDLSTYGMTQRAEFVAEARAAAIQGRELSPAVWEHFVEAWGPAGTKLPDWAGTF